MATMRTRPTPPKWTKMIRTRMPTGMTILSPTTRTSRTHAECLSMEGDDPSILEWDDYFNGLTSYSSELYTLRQRLAWSEQTKNFLQMEFMNA